MTVLYLVRRKVEPDNVAALRELLELAISGRLMGLSCSYIERDGAEDHITTGFYRRRPAEALRASLRATMILTQVHEPP